MENETNNKADLFSGVKSKIKPYHLIIENIVDNRILKAVLFGFKYYSKSVNYGSEIGIQINPADANVTMLELFEQSASIQFKPKGIKIIADNWDMMPESLYYKDIEYGQQKTISLVDNKSWGVKEVLGKAVNDIPLSKILINDKIKMILSINSLSKIEVLFY